MRNVVVAALLFILPFSVANGGSPQAGGNVSVGDPKSVVEAFFAAHTRGDVAAMEAMYTSAATVSFTAPGQSGALQVMSLPVKQYLGWFQGQFASRNAMKFVVGQTVVNAQGGFAVTWIPLEIHETMKDGSQKTVRAVASLHLFRDGGAWKITAHAWQSLAN